MNGGRLMDLSGWEALVHGVFAITITLLVLDIRVPPIDSTPTGAALVEALLAGGPRYVAYVLSFMYVGAYWIATHRSLRMARAVDHKFLVIGLMYLGSIALIPFVSKLLAEYIGADQGRGQVVVVFFIAWQVVISFLACISMLYSSRAGLFRPDLDEAEIRRWLRLAAAGCAIWIAATVAAVFVGSAALAFPFVLLVVYLWDRPAVTKAPPNVEQP